MIYTPEPQPMPVAGPLLGDALSTLLEERGIAFYPNQSLQAIDPERNELVFSDDTRAGFDLLAATSPHKSPSVVSASPLGDERGWIPVDNHTLQTRFENVYAIGDVASITLTNGKPLPKAGVFAHAEGLTVAATLARSINGDGPAEEFDGKGYCWVEIGNDKAAFARGDFYAEPDPDIQLHSPGRSWHLGKVLFERYWMGTGLEQTAAGLGLAAGGKIFGVPNMD